MPDYEGQMSYKKRKRRKTYEGSPYVEAEDDPTGIDCRQVRSLSQ